MAAVLPILCFGLAWLVARRAAAQETAAWRRTFVRAALGWGLWAVVVTELASAAHALTRTVVLSGWALACLCLGAALWRWRARLPSWRTLAKAPLGPWLAGAAIAAILGGVALIAVVAAPTSWDAMAYHMSRVVHWMQNRSVAHYPTHIQTQLYHNPGAEFLILHFQLLARGDRLAALPEWFGFAGSVLGVSLIAGQLGGDRRTQLVAALLCATLPSGILLGSSTKNNYVLTFWLVCLVVELGRWRAEGGMQAAVGAGLALGLAILTKGSAYLLALPFVIGFAVAELRAHRLAAWRGALVVGALTVALNAGHFARNLSLYGYLVVSHEQESDPQFHRLDAETLSPAAAASGLVRNLALHLGTPWPRVNRAIDRAIAVVHHGLGIDENDPRTTLGNGRFFVRPASLHEELAGNPLHLLLGMALFAAALGCRTLRKQAAWGYVAACAGAFFLLCFLLKWQPYHARNHLTVFVLFCPAMALVLARAPRAAAGVSVLLLLAALPPLLCNQSRPLFGEKSIFTRSRLDQYFADYPQIEPAYVRAADFIQARHCNQVGLVLGGYDWEYPLWVLLGVEGGQGPRIEHVDVKNASAAAYGSPHFAPFDPCGLVVIEGGTVRTLARKRPGG